MTKAVLFDLFETLISEAPKRPVGAADLCNELGFDHEEFKREWKPRRQSILLGRICYHDALAEIGTVLGRPIARSRLQRLREDRIRIKEPVFDRIEPQVESMVSALRSRGVLLGLVSNCFPEDVTRWPHCPLARRFNVAVFSYEAGLTKPDPEIYLEACRRLHTTPAETLFVGDGLRDELSGAERTGMRAYQALWFLRRWPHFSMDQARSPFLETVEELLNLVP